MIAGLRRRHRWTVTILAVVVPVLFVVALTWRQEIPAVDVAPGAEHEHAEHANPP